MTLGMIDSCQLPGSGPAKKLVFTPVAPIIAATRIAQKWGLFDGASRTQFRMHVEVQYDGRTWIPLFIASDPDFDEYAEQLEYRRVRGAWNPRKKQPTGVYDRFANWLMNRVFTDHDDAVAARIVMDRVAIDEWGGMTVVETELFKKLRRHRPGSGRP